MAFLHRLFQRGKSKKQQNEHATDDEGVTPKTKTRHSLSVINALVDRDRQKAQSSTHPSADSPLDEDPSLTRLLRTNSANFRVITEIDYKALPPLSHPINDVLGTAPASGDENNFKVEVGRRRIHARSEFPRANSPLSHLDSSHSCELPPESTDNDSDTEGQEGRRRIIKPKPNSYSTATSSIKVSIAPKDSPGRRLSGNFARPAPGQQEATVSTRATSTQGGHVVTCGPSEVIQLTPMVLVRPLAQFLTSSYIQAGDILRTSRRVEWFSLQALHISHQAFQLIIRFNGSVGPDGPTEEQLDEGLELDDALEELEDKIDELVTLSLDDAHNDEEGHRYDLNRLYQIFFQRRGFFLDERDYRTNRIFEHLAATDHADIMRAIHLRELNAQRATRATTGGHQLI